MKNKIECASAAILIVLSFMFIIEIVGLIIPRHYITVILLIYCVHIIYKILNPPKRFYFATFWLPRGDRGRIFIKCDKFRVYDVEKDIASYTHSENVVIDYYMQISKEEYEYQTELTTKKKRMYEDS